MSWSKNKKIIIFLGIAVIVLSGFFYYLIGILTARAQEQIKIFPTSFSGDWQNPGAVFSQDLGEEAVFREFNANNSAYPLEQKQQERTGFWEKIKNFFKEVVFAQEEPPQELPQELPQESPKEPVIKEQKMPVEKVLELSNFSISDNFKENKINNVQLRLSLAASPPKRETDAEQERETDAKLLIEYYYKDAWQNLAEFDLKEEISNAKNGGYFLYGLPIFENWTDLKNLRIKFTYSGFQDSKVFLDALWLEVEYEEIKKEPPKIIEVQPRPIGERKDFRSDEEPKFDTGGIFPQKKGLLNKITSFFGKKEITEATLINPRGEESSEGVIIDGTIIKIKPDQRSFRPGLYKLKIKKGGEEIIQEFTWGVLAINTNKSIYLAGETAYLQMAALTDSGHTICDANLKIEVISPDGGISDLGVQKSGECGPNNVTNVPDYFAYYQVGEVGTYQMELTNLDNGYEITDQFEVRESVPFDIERVGPTRIYPPAIYEMSLRIKANQDFAGQVVETLPESFQILDCQSCLAENSSPLNAKRLVWQVDWKTGETQELKYQFDAPDISPYLYLLGPLEFYE